MANEKGLASKLINADPIDYEKSGGRVQQRGFLKVFFFDTVLVADGERREH